jgi:hypothetical protein
MSKYKSKIKTTSNIEKPVPNLISLQKKFDNNLKFTITEYANDARYEINKNAKIQEHISRLKYIKELFKKLLTDIINNKGGKKEIYKLLISNNNIFKEDNNTLKSEIREEKKKLNKYQNALNKEIKPLKEKINQLKDSNFILKNKLIYQQNCIIRKEYLLLMLDDNYEGKKKIEVKLNSDLNAFDEFLLEISKVYQLNLLKLLKELNKIKIKNAENLQKKNILLKIKNAYKENNNNNIYIELNNNNNNDNDYKLEEENKEISKNINESSSLYFNEFELLSSFSMMDNLEAKIQDNGKIINASIYNLPQKKLIKSNINNIDKPLTFREINYNNNYNIKKIKIKRKRAFSYERFKNCNQIENNIKKELELPKLNLRQINFNQDNKNYNFSSNIGRRVLSIHKYNIKKNETMKNEKTKIKNNIK